MLSQAFASNILVFFPLTTALSSACAQRFGGLAKAGLPLLFLRGTNFQVRTVVSAGYCPACAKPQVRCWCFIHYFYHKAATIGRNCNFLRCRTSLL